MEQTTWRKSTRSGSNSNCVELAGTLDALRDSKNADGPILRVDLSDFLADVKAGRYDA
jgi:hypothetical protein